MPRMSVNGVLSIRSRTILNGFRKRPSFNCILSSDQAFLLRATHTTCINSTKAGRVPISSSHSLLNVHPVSWSSIARSKTYGQRRTSISESIAVETAFQEQKPKVCHSRPLEECDIKITDYSADRIVEHDLSNTSLQSFLQERPKPDLSTCRWIYVNGINADIIKSLGNHHRLHPLAIEDVLDTSTLAKADFYEGHCFLEMTLQKLVHLQSHRRHGQSSGKSEITTAVQHSEISLHGHRDKWHAFLEGRFGMAVEQVSIFLTSDNTVITVFEHSGQSVFTPVMSRLQSTQTILRSSNDPSMLVHAVVDVIVDLSLPIGKAVSNAFTELEENVLTAPSIAQSRELYVLRSGLTHLMDNINAIGGLVRILCDHRNVTASPKSSQGDTASNTLVQQSPSGNSVAMSSTAQVYLQDVQDHIQTLSKSTHMSIRTAENLTSLIFNTIAASQNESVRQLTLVSSFFLPLTFLTGYFGMNFDPMPVVQNNSDIFFWYIATPIMLSMAILLAARSRRVLFSRMRRRHHAKTQLKG